MVEAELEVLDLSGYPGTLGRQIVVSLDRMLIAQNQEGSPWSSIVEPALVTLSQLPCVATPLHT